MEEEIKKAYMDWSEKGVSYLNCMCVYDIMMDVDDALQTCDTILDEIDLGIDYTSREKDIDRLLEGHGTLHRYIDVLNCYVDDKLDQPLKKDFKKNATETISRIHLEDFEVDNTLGLTENNYITGGMGYAGTMVEQEKAKLTFADFIGTSDGKADGNGLHMAYTNGSVEDFASIFAAQYEAMKASGALGEDNNLTQQEFLEQFYRQGEFTHDSSNPFLNFVSSVLDITIIKPIIEACTGEDLITGEDLTDMERGLKVVFAVVDLVTLGGAIAATKFSEMGLKEGLKAFGKTALIDFAGNTAACGVGALGETFDWPVPITMMLSLAAGITVSISGNKLLFKNADGIEIGSKTLSDDDLKIVEQTIEGENYSNLTEVVSAKEAEVYLHFLESGSTEGMTESELKAVQKIEELIKSNKIDYDGILKIRNETVKSDVEVVRKTTEDSVEDVGKNAAEDAGKVVESGIDTKIKPSNPYNVDAKPSGTVTKITNKMDEATKRSLMRENEAAETIAKNGYNIEQNPVIEGTTRNPDYIIEGEIFDCYSPAENTKIRNVASTIEEKVIKKGQTERVVLDLDDWKGDVNALVKQLNDYPIEGLKEVIVVHNGSVQSIYP